MTEVMLVDPATNLAQVLIPDEQGEGERTQHALDGSRPGSVFSANLDELSGERQRSERNRELLRDAVSNVDQASWNGRRGRSNRCELSIDSFAFGFGLRVRGMRGVQAGRCGVKRFELLCDARGELREFTC
ncbi:hypothetical protein ACFPRL_04005 [Pseudoclavibacter helvolus]